MASHRPGLFVRAGIQIAAIPPDLFSFFGGSMITVAINIVTGLIYANIHVFLLVCAVFCGLFIGISSIQCIFLGRSVTELQRNAEVLKDIPYSGNKDKSYIKLFEILLESKDFPYGPEFEGVARRSITAFVLIMIGIGFIIGGKSLEFRSLDILENQSSTPTIQVSNTPGPILFPRTSSTVTHTPESPLSSQTLTLVTHD